MEPFLFPATVASFFHPERQCQCAERQGRCIYDARVAYDVDRLVRVFRGAHWQVVELTESVLRGPCGVCSTCARIAHTMREKMRRVGGSQACLAWWRVVALMTGFIRWLSDGEVSLLACPVASISPCSTATVELVVEHYHLQVALPPWVSVFCGENDMRANGPSTMRHPIKFLNLACVGELRWKDVPWDVLNQKTEKSTVSPSQILSPDTGRYP